MGGAQHDSEAGRVARRAIGAFGLPEKIFKQQLTYIKNPRIPSSLNILPMALKTPLPRKEKSYKRAGVALSVSRALCSHQPQNYVPPKPLHQQCSRQLCSPPPQPKGCVCTLPVCNNAWDNIRLADNCLNAEARRALLGFVQVNTCTATTAHNMLRLG